MTDQEDSRIRRLLEPRDRLDHYLDLSILVFGTLLGASLVVSYNQGTLPEVGVYRHLLWAGGLVVFLSGCAGLYYSEPGDCDE